MKLDHVLLASDGRFVRVTFIKKDGSTRVLNGRLGVKKHLAGGVSTLDAEKFVTIYDVQNKGYRAVNRETIQEVAIDGVIYVA